MVEAGHNRVRESSQQNSICCRGTETSPPTYVILTTSSHRFHYIKQSIG